MSKAAVAIASLVAILAFLPNWLLVGFVLHPDIHPDFEPTSTTYIALFLSVVEAAALVAAINRKISK